MRRSLLLVATREIGVRMALGAAATALLLVGGLASLIPA